MKKKPITTRELMRHLESDPAYQARVEALAHEEAELRKAEGPLLRDLAAAGIEVASVWYVANIRKPYTRVLPILIDHIQRPYPIAIKEGIARALAVRESRFAWPLLLKLYDSALEPRMRDALAQTLSGASHDGVIEDVIERATNPGNGASRLHLLPALKRSKDPRAFATIKTLVSDSDFTYEVTRYLRAREKRTGRDPRRTHK
jgi:hypothetical protein